MDLQISTHAEKRIRKRLGIPKRSVKKVVESAFSQGVTFTQSRGQLRKYFTHLWQKTNDKPLIRIYNRYAWIFVNVRGGGYRLKTTYNIPSTLYKLEDAIRCHLDTKQEESQ